MAKAKTDKPVPPIKHHEFVQAPRDGSDPLCNAPQAGSGMCLRERGHDIHFPVIKPMTQTLPRPEALQATSTLLHTIGLAMGLCEGGTGGESNDEYIRGQAELICDLYGLDMNIDKPMLIRILTGQS